MPSAWCSMCAEKQFDLLYHAVLIISALDRERKHGTLHILHYALYAMICIAESGLRAKWSILGQNHVHINTDIDRKETCNGRKEIYEVFTFTQRNTYFSEKLVFDICKSKQNNIVFLSQRRRTTINYAPTFLKQTCFSLSTQRLTVYFMLCVLCLAEANWTEKVHMTK